MKLVVDTSVLVSMLLSKRSIAWRIFEARHEYLTLDLAFLEVTSTSWAFGAGASWSPSKLSRR